MAKKYSIIVPHYNDTKQIAKLFESMDKLDLRECEIVVIDDSSSPEQYSTLRNLIRNKDIKLIRTKKNSGPTVARNEGIRESEGELLVFTDSDCIVPMDWLETISNFYRLKENRNKVLQGRAEILKSGIIGQCTSSIGFPAGGSIGFEKIWPVNKEGETKQLVTCNCVIPRHVLDDAGLFDPTLPLPFGDDTDLGLRIIGKGYKIRFDPLLFVYHPARDSLTSFIKWTWTRGKGSYYFRKKNAMKDWYKIRLWSSKNILVHGMKTVKFPLVAFFLFCYLSIFYAGFVYEKIKRYRIQ